MKTKILAMMFTSSVLLTACGGSDNSSGASSSSSTGTSTGTGTTTGTGTSTGTGTTTTSSSIGKGSDQDTTKLVNSISGIAIREAMYLGLVNSIIEGANRYLEGDKCTTGSYSVSGKVLTFNNCVGVMDSTSAVTGVIDTSSGYQVKNLVVKDPNGNGTSQTINGNISMNTSGSTTAITSSDVNLVSQEFNSAKKLITVKYDFSDYNFVWTTQDSSHVKVQFATKFAATGGEYGDYKVAIDNSASPYYFTIDKDNTINDNPYEGTLIISDLNNTTNVISLATVNTAKVEYKATINSKVLFDNTVNWADITYY